MSDDMWHKSTRSNPSGNCVEVNQAEDLVRDSKLETPDGKSPVVGGAVALCESVKIWYRDQ
jgi:Domain of unknown function (DUF397)